MLYSHDDDDVISYFGPVPDGITSRLSFNSISLFSLSLSLFIQSRRLCTACSPADDSNSSQETVYILVWNSMRKSMSVCIYIKTGHRNSSITFLGRIERYTALYIAKCRWPLSSFIYPFSSCFILLLREGECCQRQGNNTTTTWRQCSSCAVLSRLHNLKL